MKNLALVFLFQVSVVVLFAIPTYFYLKWDYAEFHSLKQFAQTVPQSVGAVCSDSWFSRSTGSGTCSHHGGVRHWGATLRQIAASNWLDRISSLLVFLGAGVIGWFGIGSAFVFHIAKKEMNELDLYEKECCSFSRECEYSFCSDCGASLTDKEARNSALPRYATFTYLFMTTSLFLIVGIVVVSVGYLGQTPSPDLATNQNTLENNTPPATPTASPTVSPTVTTKSSVPKPNSNSESNTTSNELDVEGLPEVTPLPSYSPIQLPQLATSTPKRPIMSEIIVSATDVLSAGYSRPEDSRVYRFRLKSPARIQGNFSARGNVSVQIKGGYYSSNGFISGDSIEVNLPQGAFEVLVTARETVSFSLRLSAFYCKDPLECNHW